MKRSIAAAQSLAIILLSAGPGAQAWAANIAAASIRVAPPGAGVSAAFAGAGAYSLKTGAMRLSGGSGSVSLGATLLKPVSVRPGVQAAHSMRAQPVGVSPLTMPGTIGAVKAADVALMPRAGVSRTPSIKAKDSPAGFSQAGRGKKASARKVLAGAHKSFTAKPGGKLSASAGKFRQDRFWNRIESRPGATDGAPEVDASFKDSPRPAPGLKSPAARKSGKRRMFLAVPLVIGAIAAGKEAVKTVEMNATAAGWLETATAIFASLPAWAQTSAQVGGAFGVAWIAPKIVKAGFKYLFTWVDWDPLRESYVTSVASAAAWFGASAYAVMMLGGALSLTLNLGVFAAATALASQDLAKNLSAGYKLYKSGRLKIGRRVEIWDEKGRVEEINPRFTVINTADNPAADYDRVLMPNEKLKDKVVTDWNYKSGTKLSALAFLALLPPMSAGPVGMAIQAAGITVLALAAAEIFSVKSHQWDAKARGALAKDDLDLYETYAKRSKLHAWIRNGIYFAGLWAILGMFGMPLSWAAFGMTVFSAAVGFYTKSVATDLVAGLMVAYWRPFTVGDYVQVAGTKGWVEDIDQSFLYIKKDVEGRPVDAIPLERMMKEKIKIGKKAEEAAQ